ncbi:hypothetical protein GCM10010510_49520 [Streptomyces anandii JCM 4720]|nr:hypothetical protein GCM10010510_49520 [Streptomyces anandii JCM 4720]
MNSLLGPAIKRVDRVGVCYRVPPWIWDSRGGRPSSPGEAAASGWSPRAHGRPREVTDVDCFLLSPGAGGINGANVCVDGAQDHPSAGRFFPRKV